MDSQQMNTTKVPLYYNETIFPGKTSNVQWTTGIHSTTGFENVISKKTLGEAQCYFSFERTSPPVS